MNLRQVLAGLTASDYVENKAVFYKPVSTNYAECPAEVKHFGQESKGYILWCAVSVAGKIMEQYADPDVAVEAAIRELSE